MQLTDFEYLSSPICGPEFLIGCLLQASHEGISEDAILFLSFTIVPQPHSILTTTAKRCILKEVQCSTVLIRLPVI
jgi:hypothetical protein